MRKVGKTPVSPKRELAAVSVQSKEPVGDGDRLKALLDRELAPIEKLIRDFQAKVAGINSDAGYEVKRAADYFLEDARSGINDVIAKMQSTDYKPHEFGAAVMDGDYEDVPLIGHEPTVPNGTQPLKQLEGTEALATGPVAPRSSTKKVRKA